MKKIVIVIMTIVIIGLTTYFILFSPFSSKPNIEKPIGSVVNETHIAWLVNELGSYKLHSNPVTGEEPEMEIVCSKTYDVMIEKGYPNVVEGSATNPDIRITTQDQFILELLNETDVLQNTYEMQQEGKLAIGMLKPQEDLALKGYITIYNEITGLFLF
ncbi:MAG: hypothetical protein KJ697_01340 [Nanoarchaeota archaeon]|nr:hypothetical protein [Nanoarchaeota archaeon]MBU4124057.1 hypothetical protein [Nanoarchaeota archaeon]